MTRPTVHHHEGIGPDCPLDCLAYLMSQMSYNRLGWPMTRRSRSATWRTCTQGTSSATSGDSGQSAPPRSQQRWFSPGSTSPGASSPRDLPAAKIICGREGTGLYHIP